MSNQIPLELPHRPAAGREDFLVADANRTAVDWIDRWPEWPAPALVLFGGPGSGKSHLLAVWRERAGALMIAPDHLKTDGLDHLVGEAAAIAIDNADRASEPDALLHLYNMMRDRGGSLLLTSRTAPARWTAGPPDLHSRLKGAPAAELREPDDTLLGAVMMKLFADRQLRVPAEVLTYILLRMPRSLGAARALVGEIDQAALARHRPITKVLAREVLSGHHRDGSADGP